MCRTSDHEQYRGVRICWTPIQHLAVVRVSESDSDKVWFMLITSLQGHPPQMGRVLSPSSSQNESYNDAITSQDAEMRVELTERRFDAWQWPTGQDT
jgi:hypothetical protein